MKKLCGITNELLVDYIYGEMEEISKVKELEGHLQSCASCAAEVKELNLVKRAAQNADINFSADIWAVHKQGVLRKLEKRENVFLKMKEAFFSTFSFKVLGLAALVLLMSGVGIRYYHVLKVSQEQKAISEQMELLQNFEIIERLDFYEKISKN